MSAVKEFRKAGLSYRAIIQELEARGFKSRSGKTFSPMQVKRIAA
jgi:hypothetical protein